MKLTEVKDTSAKKVVVVYGGRFQPPHPGHVAVYKWLVSKFGADNVWISMSARTNFDPSNGSVSPFTFDERKQMFVELFKDGPPSEKIILCKDPTFKPIEILKKIKDAVYVAAVSEKDVARYEQSKFFKPFPDDAKISKLKSYDEQVNSYYVMVPMQKDSISSTQVRKMLMPNVSNKVAKANFETVYGRFDETLYKTVREKLAMIEKKDDESKSD